MKHGVGGVSEISKMNSDWNLAEVLEFAAEICTYIAISG